MKKKILVILTITLLVGCSSKQEKPKQAVKTEEKNIKSNPTLDEIDPVQNGDLNSEKESIAESKAEIYKAFEYAYSPEAKHNKGKDKIELKGLKNYDKVVLDGIYKAIDQIIEKCEKENRYFRKSEMEILKLQAEEITRLTEKWTKFIENK